MTLYVDWKLMFIQSNYAQIKQEIENLVDTEMGRVLNDPEVAGTVI